jgi:hypothetical protein
LHHPAQVIFEFLEIFSIPAAITAFCQVGVEADLSLRHQRLVDRSLEHVTRLLMSH